MKTKIIILGVLAAVTAHAGTEAVPGEFIVRLRSSASPKALAARMNRSGLKLTETLSASQGVYLAKGRKPAGPTGLSALSAQFKMAKEIEALPEVESVEPNYVIRLGEASQGTLPNDARFVDQWALKNSGQDVNGHKGTAGADIHAEDAWRLSTGSRDVVVAVVDTGIDYAHPDLKANIWNKPGQPEVHGYNAITDVEDPQDDNNHGTHCAGVIGAMGGNEHGITGVNWNVSFMGAKFLDGFGSGSTASAIKAIDYAVNHGARVINASWGGVAYSKALEDAFRNAGEKGVVVVAAAGNDSSDSDKSPQYPANFKLDNVMAVAGSDSDDALMRSSNFGIGSVLLMAPAQNILSTVTGGKYAFMTGTSMATAHVSGAVALLLSREPNLTPAQIRERLISSVDKIDSVREKLISGGRLNLSRLLGGM